MMGPHNDTPTPAAGGHASAGLDPGRAQIKADVAEEARAMAQAEVTYLHFPQSPGAVER